LYEGGRKRFEKRIIIGGPPLGDSQHVHRVHPSIHPWLVIHPDWTLPSLRLTE